MLSLSQVEEDEDFFMTRRTYLKSNSLLLDFVLRCKKVNKYKKIQTDKHHFKKREVVFT